MINSTDDDTNGVINSTSNGNNVPHREFTSKNPPVGFRMETDGVSEVEADIIDLTPTQAHVPDSALSPILAPSPTPSPLPTPAPFSVVNINTSPVSIPVASPMATPVEINTLAPIPETAVPVQAQEVVPVPLGAPVIEPIVEIPHVSTLEKVEPFQYVEQIRPVVNAVMPKYVPEPSPVSTPMSEPSVANVFSAANPPAGFPAESQVSAKNPTFGNLGVNSFSNDGFTNHPIASASTSTPVKSGGGLKQILILLLILIIILLGGATAYAYIKKMGPFAPSTYTEANFSSSMLAKIGQINTATYTSSGAVNVVARDKDATIFNLVVSNDKELKLKYFYDGTRLKDALGIISGLNSGVGYYSNYGAPTATKKLYKSYTTTLVAAFTSKNITYSLFDPETSAAYAYKVTEDGKNFELVVDFATDDAIKTIKGSGYSATSTKIEGKKVTFTKDSYFSSYSFSGEPPKPFLTQMSGMLSMIPPQASAKIAVSASSDLSAGAMADWSFNLDATGDFGDMTYKINADALKKGDNYYFKINNMPSFFLFDALAKVKGKWVVVPSKASSTESATASSTGDNVSSPFSFIQTSIPEQEAKYKENRDKFVKFIKKVVAIADEEKIILFRNAPKTENLDGRNLVKYDLSLRKEKIISFYTRVQSEITTNPDFAEYAAGIDQGYLDYLKSDEFSQVFDYFDKNNSFAIWTDGQGFPVVVQNTMRVVPPDDATQLKDKQINVTFKLDISNINKPITIETPVGATPIDKLSDSVSSSLTGARSKGQDAAIQSSLSNMRAQAELIYDNSTSSKNSYGKNPFGFGVCKQTAGTLFGDKVMFSLINQATNNDPSKATCVSMGMLGKVDAWALSAPMASDNTFSWCVDNTGASKKILGAVSTTKCK
ncbi:MAG: hypothetical protein WCQ00_03745 [bacterium]